MKWCLPANDIRSVRAGFCTAFLILFSCIGALSQIPGVANSAVPAQPEAPKDSLARTTPRSTVLAFLGVARKGDYRMAAEFLDTQLRGKAAAVLAFKLSVVLDRRLPARLNQLSDKPEGSRFDPLHPDRDLVGIVNTDERDLEILLVRVDRDKSGLIWLFSGETLKSIPDVYDEINVVSVEEFLPSFLVTTRVFEIPLFEWAAVLLGLPLLYFLTVLLNYLLSSLVGRVRRRLTSNPNLIRPQILHKPTRLLLIAFTINYLRSRVGLSLLARQFWAGVAVVIATTAVVWILILFVSRGEQYVHERLGRRNLAGTASLLRLTRRVIDLSLVFAGILVILDYFGFSPTAALAGLGVGGIAIALAAQKTLENVIGGVSLILDQVVRVGDTLKVGDVLGQVVAVGLRSTRIRTLDRTVVSIPNGQMAIMNLEILSARDKFWFHPLIGLRHSASPEQIQSILDGIRALLSKHPAVDHRSVRVRFLGFGASSLDVDVFAYLHARDWSGFLEIQEGVLFSIMKIVRQSGAQIALPSQLMYLAPRETSTMSEFVQPDVRPGTPGLEVTAATG